MKAITGGFGTDDDGSRPETDEDIRDRYRYTSRGMPNEDHDDRDRENFFRRGMDYEPFNGEQFHRRSVHPKEYAYRVSLPRELMMELSPDQMAGHLQRLYRDSVYKIVDKMIEDGAVQMTREQSWQTNSVSVDFRIKVLPFRE